MADVISDWTDDPLAPQTGQMSSDRITDLHNRLTGRIRDEERRLQKLNQEALDLQSKIARMRDTADKLHLMHWAEHDSQALKELEDQTPTAPPEE